MTNWKVEGPVPTAKNLQAIILLVNLQKINLQPKGENNGWLQSFDIYEGKQIKNAQFIVNDKELILTKNIFRLHSAL